MASITFSPALLHSHSRFFNFFQDTDTIQKVAKESLRPRPIGYGKSLSQNPIKLHCTFALAKIKIVAAKAFRILSEILGKLGSKTAALCMKVLYNHCVGLDLFFAFRTYGDRWLVPSVNTHQIHTWDVYSVDAMPLASIQDSKIKSLCFPSFLHSHIEFFHPKGICRGIAHRFAQLYLQTQKRFQDAESHAMAVAAQFTLGADRQASLLHSLCFTSSLLQFQYEQDIVISPWEKDAEQQIERALKTSTSGIYIVNGYRHSLNLVKAGPDQFYLFDSNLGLIRCNLKQTASMLMSYKGPGNAIFDQIEIRKVTLS